MNEHDCMCEYCMENRKRIGRDRLIRNKIDGLIFVLIMFVIFIAGVVGAVAVMR